jgi:hypothetical protein
MIIGMSISVGYIQISVYLSLFIHNSIDPAKQNLWDIDLVVSSYNNNNT